MDGRRGGRPAALRGRRATGRAAAGLGGWLAAASFCCCSARSLTALHLASRSTSRSSEREKGREGKGRGGGGGEEESREGEGGGGEESEGARVGNSGRGSIQKCLKGEFAKMTVYRISSSLCRNKY